MSAKIEGNQKRIITTTAGFQGVVTASEFTNGNIFDQGTLGALNRSSIVCFNK